MTIRNFADVIVAIAVLLLPIISTYLTNVIKKNSKLSALISILPTIAKDAVVAMQKLGVTEVLDGAVKKNKAIQTAKEALISLGYDQVDEQILANAIEQAYAQLKAAGTLDTYPQAKEASK